MLIRYYTKGCKTVADVRKQLVKALTHGNVFLYHNEPNKDQLLAEARSKAEAYADQLIKDQIDTLPPKIKRESTVH